MWGETYWWMLNTFIVLIRKCRNKYFQRNDNTCFQVVKSWGISWSLKILRPIPTLQFPGGENISLIALTLLSLNFKYLYTFEYSCFSLRRVSSYPSRCSLDAVEYPVRGCVAPPQRKIFVMALLQKFTSEGGSISFQINVTYLEISISGDTGSINSIIELSIMRGNIINVYFKKIN